MSELKFITRHNQSPQGKQRVFISCHKDNFKRCFSEITSDIFKTQNCACYYYDNFEDSLSEDNLSELLNMQLFVVLVTHEFIFTQNRARLVELKFALDNNIPVLPIMCDSGLESDFNRICGEIQFLEKYSDDTTRIPYSEKLSRYLASILIGDEAAEKIRSAFDAYIFLSYRKKDRKVAKELMQLIHKNELCRDIAFWYDEFLVPGENFNEAIFKAMEKSQLFTLAVTPNLVNEENYIMTTEYPAALKSGMKVLPVQMEKTNEDELKKNYKDIPKLVDAKDTESFNKMLLESLKDVAVRTHDASMEHTFFIGLAYYGGIDVENDRERGLSLIETAANAGLVEAIRKLYSIYKNGDGTKCDYSKAYIWQEKLIDQLETEYNYLRDEDSALAYFDEMYRFCRDCFDMRDADMAKTMFPKMEKAAMEIAESFGNKRCIMLFNNCEADFFGKKGMVVDEIRKTQQSFNIAMDTLLETQSSKARYDAALSCRRSAILFNRIGDTATAKKMYETAVNFVDCFGVNKDFSDIQYDVYIGMVNVLLEMRKMGDAAIYLAKAEEAVNAISSSSDSITVQQMNAGIYSAHAELCSRQGKHSEAFEWKNKQLDICEEIAKTGILTIDKINLGESYRRYSSIALEAGKIKVAKDYAQKAVSIFEPLSGRTPTAEVKGYLAMSYEALAMACKNNGAIAMAESYFEKAIAQCNYISDKFKSDGRHLETKRSSCLALGGLKLHSADFKSAEKYFEMAVEIAENQLKSNDTLQNRLSLVNAYSHLSTLHFARKDYKAIEDLYKKEIAVYEDAMRATPTMEIKMKMADVLKRLAQLYNTEKDYSNAEASAKAAIELLESENVEPPYGSYGISLMDCYKCMADIYAAVGKKTASIDACNKSLETSEKLSKRGSNAVVKRSIAKTYMLLGDLLSDTNPDESGKNYGKCLGFMTSLAGQTESVHDYLVVAGAYRKCGLLCRGKNKLEETKVNLKKSASYYDKACKIAKDIELDREAANLYLYIAELIKSLNHLGESETFLQRAYTYLESIAQRSKTEYDKTQYFACMLRFGDIHAEMKHQKVAEEYYVKAMRYAEAMANELKSEKSFDAVALSYYRLGVFSRSELLLKTALYYWEKLALMYPENTAYKDKLSMVKRALN